MASSFPTRRKRNRKKVKSLPPGLVNISEDGSRQSLDVNAGDRVLFGKYGGSEITVNGEGLLIMREDEILGIITRAGAAAGGKKSK